MSYSIMTLYVHPKICLTGNQVIIDLLLQLAVQHNLTLTLIARLTANTSTFCEEFKKRVGQKGCFIESNSEDHAIYKAMGAAYGGALVILCISNEAIYKGLEGLSHAIWLELPMVVISMQDNPAVNTLTLMQADLKRLLENDLAFPVLTLSEEPSMGKTIRLAVDMAFRLMTPLILIVDASALVKTHFLPPEILLSCQLSQDVFSTFYRGWQVPGQSHFKSVLGRHYLGFSEEKLKQELSYYRNKIQEITVFNKLIGWCVINSLVNKEVQPLTRQKKSLYNYLVQLIKEAARETDFPSERIVLISSQYGQYGTSHSEDFHHLITAAGYELSIALGLKVVRSDLKIVVILYASILTGVQSWLFIEELSQQQNLMIFVINDLQSARIQLLGVVKKYSFIHIVSRGQDLLKKELMNAFKYRKTVILEINIPQFFH